MTHYAFSDLFKARYDLAFTEPYSFRKGDFVQLAAFLKSHSGMTPEVFVSVAENDWKNGPYKSTASLSIAGLCAGWSRLLAKQQTSVKPKQQEKSYEF
jgi:hypothetical protein